MAHLRIKNNLLKVTEGTGSRSSPSYLAQKLYQGRVDMRVGERRPRDYRVSS
jgi:hypothetical protein